MNKLISCLVVSAFLYSSNSAAINNELRVEAQRLNYDENFIANGNFNLPVLSQFDLFEYRNSLQGWSADEIERGRGNVYNQRWGSMTVIELDGTHNDILKQRIFLNPGHYMLSFRWAGRVNNLGTSGMSILWNGRKIFEVLQAHDDLIHLQQIPIFVLRQNNYVLELRGEERSDGLGMTVANFELKRVRSNQDLILGERQPI